MKFECNREQVDGMVEEGIGKVLFVEIKKVFIDILWKFKQIKLLLSWAPTLFSFV